METQVTTETNPGEFTPGSSVIYAMHGKCRILGTETRALGGQSIRFYKLEIKKSPLSRSHRQEPAIWVPVSNARDQGMRAPMSKEEANEAFKILSSREYYFKLQETWTGILPQLEAAIKTEGGIGLAKVASYLHVLKKKQIVASSEVNKFQETIHKLLFRELSEALNEPSKGLEEKAIRGFRVKLLPDS